MSSFEMPIPGPNFPASADARFDGRLLRRIVYFCIFCVLLAAVAVPTCASAAKKKKKDRKPPAIMSIVTLDGDGDGRLDGVRLSYSESVYNRKVKKGKKARKREKTKPVYAVNGHKILSVKITSRGRIVTLNVSENENVNTAERPAVAYVRAKKGKKGIVDKAGNQAFAGVLKAKDGIGPVLLSTRTTDSDGDGQIDGVVFTFSEALDKADAAGFTVPGRSITGALVAGSEVIVTVAEAGFDSDAKPNATAGLGAVTDQAGNAQGAAQAVTATDGTPPAIIQAITADRDADGRIDRIVATFSEDIQHAAETTGASLQATGFVTTDVSAPVGRDINIDFNEGGSFNTGAKPSVTISAVGQRVSDVNGNLLTPGAYAQTIDGAAPVLISAKLRDVDTDGKVDTIAATFSETVTFSGVSGFSSTAGTSVFGLIPGGGVSIGAVVNVTVSEIGSCCNTDLPTLSDPVPVTYTPPGSGGVLDTAGRSAVLGTVSATDGAGPVIDYAETEDVNQNGFIDHVYVDFSEPVAQFAGSPFLVASGQRTVITQSPNQPVLVSSGPHAGQVKLTIEERTIDDTGDRPTVSYQPPSGSHFVRDALANDMPTSVTPFTGTTDKAKPVLRGAETSDQSPIDGHIDTITTVWSEPVATSTSPNFAVTAQNPPSSYTAPTVGSGATAANQTVTVPLNASADSDRDVFFQVTYFASGGVTDQALIPNDAAAPASLFEQNADCADNEEIAGPHDDSASSPNATSLATNGSRHLATLCGDDNDFYSFSTSGGETIRALFAPTSEVFGLANRDSGFDPFTVSGPGSPTPTVTFDDGVGWYVEFTAAGGGGTYAIGVNDGNSPLADYGYCVARTDNGALPTCSVRQGDLAITELLKDQVVGDASTGPYVEVKNLTPAAVLTSDLDDLELDIGGVTCELTLRGDTPGSIATGGFFIISLTDFPGTNRDLDCPGMPVIDYGQQITIRAADGEVDSVNLGAVSIPAFTSAQVRGNSIYETSTGNDDTSGGWCGSIDYRGTPAAVNSQCDNFRLEEAMFMPSTSTRDGRVFVEIRGNAPINASSSLLANWRIRIRPQVGPQMTFTLPATANPIATGFYVLADSPDGGGDTYVPFYSSAVSDLDDYLRADTPGTISLLKPGDTCATGTPVDTIGYLPGTTGSLTGADNENNCPAYIVSPAQKATGFTTNDTLQRKPYAAYSDNNFNDWCAHAPWSPLDVNEECVVQQ